MESSTSNIQNTSSLLTNLSEAIKPYGQKYDEFLQSKNFYNMLLSVKTDLRKLCRKGNFEDYIQILSLAANLFVPHKEYDSCRTLLIESLEELEKSSCKGEAIQEKIVSLLANILENSPEVFDCNLTLMTKFFVFCEAKKIEERVLIEKEIYNLFSKICILNQDFMSAYKLALKTNKVSLIEKAVEGLANKFFPTEKEYFYARTALELLSKKKIDVAKNFIRGKIDKSENLQNNNPILNFVYFLVFVLENKNIQFENFETLIRKYQVPIELDPQLIKYLNLISKNYYDRQIIKEDDQAKKGMDLGNLMKMLSG